MITKLKSGVRTSEIDALSDALLAFYDKDREIKSDALLKNVFAELRSLSQEITDATRRDRTLSRLKEENDARNNKLRALFNIVKGFWNMPIDELKTKADVIKVVLDKYTLSIARLPYMEESALIVKLLEDLKAQEVATAAEGLAGCTQTIEELTAAQASFDSAREEYELAKAAQHTSRSATDIKADILRIINIQLVNYFNAVQLLSTEKYAQFVSLMTQEINRVNSRMNKKSSSDDSDSEPETADTPSSDNSAEA